jgi:hypothetical protein
MIKEFEKIVIKKDLCALLGIDEHKILAELYIEPCGDDGVWNISGTICDTYEEASKVIDG